MTVPTDRAKGRKGSRNPTAVRRARAVRAKGVTVQTAYKGKSRSQLQAETTAVVIDAPTNERELEQELEREAMLLRAQQKRAAYLEQLLHGEEISSYVKPRQYTRQSGLQLVLVTSIAVALLVFGITSLAESASSIHISSYISAMSLLTGASLFVTLLLAVLIRPKN